MNVIRILADPGHVARLQRFCGVEHEKPVTCDQHTQTRGESSDSDSNSEHEERPPKCLKADDADDANWEFSTPVHENSNSRITSRTRETLNCLEEYNNNINKVMSFDDTIFDEYNIDKTEYRTAKSPRANGYYLNGSASKSINNIPISECSPHPARGSLVKQNDDSVSQNDENQASSHPSPTVRIKYKSLLYLAHFGAFLGNEEFYLTFFPFGVWNLDSSVIRKVNIFIHFFLF